MLAITSTLLLMSASVPADSSTKINQTYEVLNVAWEDRVAFREAVRRYIGAHIDVCDRLKVPGTLSRVTPIWGRFGGFAAVIRRTALRLDFEIALDDANAAASDEMGEVDLTAGCGERKPEPSAEDRAFIDQRIKTSYQALDDMEEAAKAALEKLR